MGPPPELRPLRMPAPRESTPPKYAYSRDVGKERIGMISFGTVKLKRLCHLQ